VQDLAFVGDLRRELRSVSSLGCFSPYSLSSFRSLFNAFLRLKDVFFSFLFSFVLIILPPLQVSRRLTPRVIALLVLQVVVKRVDGQQGQSKIVCYHQDIGYC
jgi:hypothetical protein